MLARVKWSGPRWDGKKHTIEHGTLLQIVQHGHDLKCVITMDGYDNETRGKLVSLDFRSVTVTTYFNWMGEGHVPGLRGVGTKP